MDGVHEQVEGLTCGRRHGRHRWSEDQNHLRPIRRLGVLPGTDRLPQAPLGRFHLDLLSSRRLEPCQNRQVISTADSDLLIQTTLVEQT